ncbi:response regulator [Pseudooceanicola sediminis]|uniref:Response regulator n=1 Tax=Pseudooceanicola sediminis TaxID=2211117 RepID=A0A399J388_9RHOB|nr:response regulator [Pseudooceanicola sediminis]KAA2312368.1 response regulator [Puniceibacterium sp. HSS470]RII37416.1 response regulator [Pseudooceanicola sediminis]|tara:strand:- start:25067 stop:25774 length:708 start_codon:yes stop_codon:yes gene_type:complete
MDPLEMMSSPTATRPMLGMTILVVEDSLFASEAMRLLCLRSGARIRRADCLRSARRHLEVYRPSAVIIDMGLPDGSGAELIEQLSQATPRVAVVAAVSGDPGSEAAARNAGADCFMSKPMTNLGVFQRTLLTHMPPEYRMTGPRPVSDERVEPDPVAYKDDMAHAAEILREAEDDAVVAYLGQFLRGVAHCAGDTGLGIAADRLDRARVQGMPLRPELARLDGLLQERIGERLAI